MSGPVDVPPAHQGAASARLTSRQRLMWGLYDYAQGRGLEIGPLHQTAAPKHRADVVYLDVFDREQLLANYADNPGVPSELIPEIDYPLFDGERVRSIPETLGCVDPFDWVIASHVIEHVPDVIGWLAELAQVTADGGHLVLAVPDRRYCFDLHRPGTTVGQLLQAHEAGDVVPSVRAVYDYKRGHASVKAPAIWAGELPGYERRIYTLDTVLEQVAKARAGEYVDSHVWAFTPGSFLEQLIELRQIGLSSWKVASLTPTEHDQLEFYAILERLPRDRDWTDDMFADEPPMPTVPDWLSEQARVAQELADARAKIAQLRRVRKRLRKREQSQLSTRFNGWLRGLPDGKVALGRAQRLQSAIHRSRPWRRAKKDVESSAQTGQVLIPGSDPAVLADRTARHLAADHQNEDPRENRGRPGTGPMNAASGQVPVPTQFSSVPGDQVLAGLELGGSEPRVNLVLNSLTVEQTFAGVSTALWTATRAATRLGRQLRIVLLRDPDQAADRTAQHVAELLREHGAGVDLSAGLQISMPSVPLTSGFHPDDIWIATYWTTAVAVDQAIQDGITVPDKVLYLVQDWEPGFLPWGAQHVLALNTYRAGYRLVVNSAPLGLFLQRQAGISVQPKAIFAPRVNLDPLHEAARRWMPGDPDRPRLLFYARPSKPRNLYSLGVEALRVWASQLPTGVRPIVTCAGEDLAPLTISDRIDVVRAGKTDLAGYYDLLAQTDIGLALMCSPHPGHLALELPIAGIPTVTNEFDTARSAWVAGLSVSPATPHGLASALEDARTRAGTLRSHTPQPAPDLGGSLEEAVDFVLDATRHVG